MLCKQGSSRVFEDARDSCWAASAYVFQKSTWTWSKRSQEEVEFPGCAAVYIKMPSVIHVLEADLDTVMNLHSSFILAASDQIDQQMYVFSMLYISVLNICIKIC